MKFPQALEPVLGWLSDLIAPTAWYSGACEGTWIVRVRDLLAYRIWKLAYGHYYD